MQRGGLDHVHTGSSRLRAGIGLFDARELLGPARVIKTPEEIRCLQMLATGQAARVNTRRKFSA